MILSSAACPARQNFSSSTRGPEVYQASCTLRCYRYYYIIKSNWKHNFHHSKTPRDQFLCPLAFLAPDAAWFATRMTLATRYSWLHVSHSSHALLHNIVARHNNRYLLICNSEPYILVKDYKQPHNYNTYAKLFYSSFVSIQLRSLAVKVQKPD